MNDIVIKFLSTGDKFIPEMHIDQSSFTYSGFMGIISTKPVFHMMQPTVTKIFFFIILNLQT